MVELLRRRFDEFRAAVLLLTRIPVGSLKAPPKEADAVWAFPLVGILAALIPAAVFGLAFGLLPPLTAALLALAAGFLVTGGFHEDGLADVADGFGGGWTRARKLEIMRDSRIGTYGTLATVAGLGLRASGLAAAPDAASGALALILFGAASRALVPLLILSTPPARSDGIAATASGLSARRAAAAAVLGLIGLPLLPGGLWLAAAPILAILAMRRLTLRMIGGYTGDVLGAAQQVAEILLWIGIAAVWTAAHPLEA